MARHGGCHARKLQVGIADWRLGCGLVRQRLQLSNDSCLQPFVRQAQSYAAVERHLVEEEGWEAGELLWRTTKSCVGGRSPRPC